MVITRIYKLPFIIILLGGFFSVHFASGQSKAPLLECVSVNPGGSTVLNWDTPLDPCNSFHGYYIYASKSKGGPYTLLDSVLVLAQSTYTHLTANASINPWYYYIISKYDCFGNAFAAADTLASMKLDVINNNSGAAQISWNRPYTSIKSGGALPYYLIYREYPTGIWTLIDSTQANFYKDTIVSICSNTQLNYQIKNRDTSGCMLASSIFGGIFKDVTPPAIPIVDTVSVNPLSGYAGIGWNINPSSDTKAYVIYSFMNGIWTPTDTISGRYNTYYSGNTPPYLAAAGSKIFKVAAMDSCGNISPAILLYNTLFLASSFDVCSRTAKLTWNNYKNLAGGISTYMVYCSENGGPFKAIGSTKGNTFLHTSLKTGVAYCYIVRAWNNGLNKTSTSNASCVFNSGMPPPSFLYLKTASVVAHNEVQLEIFTDTSVYVSGYRIRRSDNPAGPFTELAEIPASKTPLIEFTDKTAITNKTEYYYYVSAYDNCGYNLITSNAGHLIKIKAQANSDFSNHVEWSDYEKWSGKVLTYSIYRSIDGVWDLKPLGIFPAGTYSYIDTLKTDAENQGMVCYRVLAEEGAGNIYQFQAQSYSDSSCVLLSPSIYIPNAFTPLGRNPLFTPISSFTDERYYQMSIYNTWGELVYQSTLPSEGWDGTSAGKHCPQGIYAYIIQIRGLNGVSFEKKGMVSLIR